MYGLKQAPRAWYERIDTFLTRLVWKNRYFSDELGKVNTNLYLKVMDNEPAILFLYVDDLFLTGNEKKISECKKKLIPELEMKDLGLMHYFLGLEVWKILEGIFIN